MSENKESVRTTIERLNIISGRQCGDDFLHNASWYTLDGKKIGWGDLSKSDLTLLAKELAPGQGLALAYEHDSYWPFVKFEISGDAYRKKVDTKEQNPGVEWLADKISYLVVDGKIYHRIRSTSPNQEEKAEEISGHRGGSKVLLHNISDTNMRKKISQYTP